MTAPTVLISGAGLGGLFLAILLDRANIPYHIYEKAPHVVPLGAGIGINANILPAFEQLGLMEEIERIGLVMDSIDLYNEKLKPLSSIDMTGYKTKAGYYTYSLHRPDLYDLFLSRVPAEKISFNKRIISYDQDKDGVTIHTSDNETYRGDILVGADGVYSTIRKTMHERLVKTGELQTKDKLGPRVTHACVTGTTKPLDPEKYTLLKDGRSYFLNIVGHAKAHTWMVMTLPNNRFSYVIQEQLDGKDTKDIAVVRSTWRTPEGKEKIIKATYNLPIKHAPHDGLAAVQEDQRTLGDLIDNTDPATISTVLFEEQLFQTWHEGRTVLIGDACHKMNPSTAQGAVNAFQDAVILVNCLYEISGDEDTGPLTVEKITEAFKDYRDQRFEEAKFQLENADMLAKVLNGQTLSEKILRMLISNAPGWYVQRLLLAKAGYRPQINFLPRIADPPNSTVVPQKPSKRYMREMKQRSEN